MPLYRYDSSEYFRAMTSPSFVEIHERSEEVGIGVGSIMMGDELEDPPVTLLMEMPPHRVLRRHSHDTFRVEIIIRGSIITPDGRVLSPGDVMTTEPGVEYGPHTAGPEGSLTAEIFGAASAVLPAHSKASEHPKETT